MTNPHCRRAWPIALTAVGQESTPVYKIRQRGEVVTVEAAKRREVRRDVVDHGGRLPDQLWDGAIIKRRNRVMNTYTAAAAVLARSDDPEDRELARATERFAAGLTNVTTERMALARDVTSARSSGQPDVKSLREDEQHRAKDRDAIKDKPEPEKGPDRKR